jgi:CubicO group peptidase (beta-lactamase class C family)
VNTLIPILIVSFLGLSSGPTRTSDPGLLTNDSTSTETEDLALRIDTYLTQSTENGFSGSALVAVEGQIILSKGYGWADRDRKIPNTSSTVFNIGSITKQFTAAGILKLMEQEKLNLSDKIERFFPEAPDDKKNITLHHLLTHTSGISPATGGFRYNEAVKEQFLEKFFQSELLSQPGEHYRYANANYIMLTAILEKVSGLEYASFLRTSLWEPANLERTGYKSFLFPSDDFAHGYFYHYSSGAWKDWGITQDHLTDTKNHWYSIGKGDLYSTVEDLYKWHQTLESDNVLHADTRTLMESPFVAEDESNRSHYGYGWAIFKSPSGSKIVTHNGSNGIYFADLIRFVEDDVVVIVLSNAILGNVSQNVAWEISRMVFNKDYQPAPLSKNIYELIYEFMRSHEPAQAEHLPAYLEKKIAKEEWNRAILNRLGFALIDREKQPAWGLEWLKLNVELFPEDGNLWDSLGEAYFKYEQKQKALNSFKQALQIGDTVENCHWCANAQEKIETIKSSSR